MLKSKGKGHHLRFESASRVQPHLIESQLWQVQLVLELHRIPHSMSYTATVTMNQCIITEVPS